MKPIVPTSERRCYFSIGSGGVWFSPGGHLVEDLAGGLQTGQRGRKTGEQREVTRRPPPARGG